MGIRSDVAVALKKNVYDGLSEESKKTLSEWFLQPQDVTREGHVFFYGESLKWYYNLYDDLMQLYAELIGGPWYEDDYFIVQACHDYPGSDEGNLGGWYENPWDIYKNWSVSLEWTPSGLITTRPPVEPLPRPNREGT